MEQPPSNALLAMSLGFALGTVLFAAFQISPMLMVVLVTAGIAAYVEYHIRT